MSEYKFSNFYQKMMIFQHFLPIFEKKARKGVGNVTPSFYESLRSKLPKKSGVTWFGESTPLRPCGRRTNLTEIKKISCGELSYGELSYGKKS